MKSSTIAILLLILTANATSQADETFSWLKSNTHSDARVYSNRSPQNRPVSKKTLVRSFSNKALQKGTVKITNRGVVPPLSQSDIQKKPLPVSIIPALKDNAVVIVDPQAQPSFDPANLSPELLKGFISALETEIDSLNNEPVIEPKVLTKVSNKIDSESTKSHEETSRQRLERLLQKMKEGK